MTVEVGISAEAHADLAAVPKNLLPEAYALMLDLKKRPRLGKRLGNHVTVGDLSDCRKLYFGNARWRIVYQLLPNDESPRKAAIIAVGRRQDMAVYMAAASRMGRNPPR